jgi:acetyltransferase-like isoleucine patch superfamily enzyme
MNKTSIAYKLIIRFAQILYITLKPIYRVIDGLKRAKLFAEIGIHSESDISADLLVKYPKNISIGKNVRIGPNCQIGAASKVTIGDDVTLSEGVSIETAGLNTRITERKHTSKEIKIEQGAWIGTKAILLGGALIGSRSIVSAGSIVKGVVPPDHLYTNGVLKKIIINEKN